MSRTNKGSKGPGFDYWKSRLRKYGWWEKPGPLTKRLTHRKERREGKKTVKDNTVYGD